MTYKQSRECFFFFFSLFYFLFQCTFWTHYYIYHGFYSLHCSYSKHIYNTQIWRRNSGPEKIRSVQHVLLRFVTGYFKLWYIHTFTCIANKKIIILLNTLYVFSVFIIITSPKSRKKSKISTWQFLQERYDGG